MLTNYFEYFFNRNIVSAVNLSVNIIPLDLSYISIYTCILNLKINTDS